MQNIILSGFADEIDNDFETQLKTLQNLHIDHICLRSAYGKNICDYTPEEVSATLLPLLTQYNIKVSSIGSPIGKVFINDEEAMAQTMTTCARTVELAKLLDCKYVRLFSFYIPEGDTPEQWQDAVFAASKQIADLFSTAQITAIHENEKDIYGDTAARCLTLCEGINSPYYKVAFDFANFVQCNEDPYAAYQLLKKHVVYFHIKDALYADSEVVVCGTGEGQIARILKEAFDEDHYEGFLTLEPHLVIFDTLQQLELADASEIIRKNKASTGEEGFTMQCEALRAILETL